MDINEFSLQNTRTSENINIWLDQDPGNDDAISLFMCLYSNQIEVKGLTITGGNTGTKYCYMNAKNLLNVWKKDHIPCFMGLGDHDSQSTNAQDFHGSNGLCDELQDYFKGNEKNYELFYEIPDHQKNMAELYEALMQQDSMVTYIITGPCTTLAYLYKTYPDVLSKIERVIIMGTSLYAGNVTEYAEFNTWADPEGLEVIMNCPAEKVVYGMEALDYVTFNLADIERIKKHPSPFSWTLVACYSKLYSSCVKFPHYTDFAVAYDPGVIPSIVKKDYAKIHPANIKIIKSGEKVGNTTFDFVDQSQNNMYVATWTNKEIFDKMLFECLDNSQKSSE